MMVLGIKKSFRSGPTHVLAVVVVFSYLSFQSGTTAFRIAKLTESPDEQMLVITTPATLDIPAPELSTSKPIPPEIYSFHVQSDIKYRYSRTLITSRVANKDPNRGQEITFSVVLPETAFISKFIMEIDGTAYEAYVKEKEQARKDYAQARSQGQSAGLVEKSTRNSNVFNVAVNVKPETKVNFNLTYEELLSRKLGRYEQAININPDQATSIKDYQVIINIEESRNLTFVSVPSLKNEIIDATANNQDIPEAVVERPAPNKAKISWTPSAADKKKLFEKQENSAKFVVQYDVDREADAGQVLLMQGYFVHFFAPENLAPLRKHVVFILDISGSMRGRKMEQMKESQIKILDDLSPDDYFNIITFSSDVNMWSPAAENDIAGQPIPVTPKNIEKAKDFINNLMVEGGTNIHDAIIEALNLTRGIREAQRKQLHEGEDEQVVLAPNAHSLIIFLTDGEPSEGVTDPGEIQARVKSANQNLSIPLYSLGFGEGADFSFLKKLSLQNNGFGRKIYEASDAALQLEGFYKEISSPLLSSVTFNYSSDDYNISDVSLSKFPTAFGGAEIAVAGKLVALPGKEAANDFVANVKGIGRQGEVVLQNERVFGMPPRGGVDGDIPSPGGPQLHTTPEDSFLERLWAYLTISQLIERTSNGVVEQSPTPVEDHHLTENTPMVETPKEKALQLALKYGFVTSLTSLVVVKPNSSDVTNAVPSSDGRPNYQHWSAFPSTPSRSSHFPNSFLKSLSSVRGLAGAPAHSNARLEATFDYYDQLSDEIATTIGPDYETTDADETTLGSLDDITWLNENNDTVNVNGSEYMIARNKTLSGDDNEGYSCYNSYFGEQGQCRHLQSCVMSAFQSDEEIFSLYFFCGIKSTAGTGSGDGLYAGVCCRSSLCDDITTVTPPIE